MFRKDFAPYNLHGTEYGLRAGLNCWRRKVLDN